MYHTHNKCLRLLVGIGGGKHGSKHSGSSHQHQDHSEEDCSSEENHQHGHKGVHIGKHIGGNNKRLSLYQTKFLKFNASE